MHLIYVIETPKFGQNMLTVILKRKKFQIYVIIIIMVTIATWLTQNYPYSKGAFFLSWELSTISCQLHHTVFLFWVITFSHTFAMGSVRCIHIFWPSIPSRGIYSHTHYFDPGEILVHPWLLFISDTYSINTKWLPHRNGSHYNFWSKLHGFKYDSMIHKSQ